MMADEGHLEELAAPYVLGALEPDEVEQVLVHIAVCARCRRAVEEASGLADLLPYAVPLVSPSPSLRQKVFARLPHRREAEAGERAVRRLSWLRWWPAAAAASIVLVFGLQALRMQQALQVAQQQTQVLAPSATQEAQLLAMVAAPQATTVALRAIQGQGAGRGRLFVDQGRGKVLLVVDQLPILTDGSVYQIWLSHEQADRPAGTLAPKPDGSGALEIPMPDDFVLYRWLRVTVERTAGGAAPAGQKVLEALLP